MTATESGTNPAETIRAMLGANGPGNVKCPAHPDGQASLAVDSAPGGEALIYCHAGCTTEAVMAALGLPMSALFPADSSRRAQTGQRRREVAAYDYTDENGGMLYQTVRYDPKDFRQRRPDGQGGWVWSLKGCRRVLYRLPQVVAAVEAGEEIWVAEGEKDCHALERAGVVATTNPMGAGKWHEEYSQFLAGATVFVVSDADDPGRKHAAKVAVSLREAGCRVSVVEPSSGHKDIAAHLGADLGFEHLTVWPEERVASRALGPLLENYWGGDDYVDRGEDVVAPWAIPGLLRVNWRAMLVGVEGHGRSVALRQIAICAAYGIHPFAFTPIPPVRTMLIDLENPDEAIMETARWIRDQCRRTQSAPTPRNQWHLWTEPMGLDLRQTRDRERFAERLEIHRPQLVCMGPVYKTHPDGKENDTEAVRMIIDFLDRMRIAYGFGLVLEHHAGKPPSGHVKRELMPVGSSLWLRWGELGFKLPPLKDMDGKAATAETMEPSVLGVRPFRGRRVKHAWPTELHRSKVWPWTGFWPQPTLDEEKF